MGKTRIEIANPSGEYHCGYAKDFFKDFALSITGPQRGYWKKEGAVASAWDYEISKKEIKANTEQAYNNSHTTLGGKFKLTNRKPNGNGIDLKGTVKSYERKYENANTASDSFTTIKATGLRGIKVDKIINATSNNSRSFLEEAIFGKQKNLDVVINDPHSSLLPARDVGKTKYSLVGDFENKSHTPNEWKLSLGKSKETIDLSRLGDERVKINNFDPKKDSIIVDGNYQSFGNILYIETSDALKQLATFTTENGNPLEITNDFSINSI